MANLPSSESIEAYLGKYKDSTYGNEKFSGKIKSCSLPSEKLRSKSARASFSCAEPTKYEELDEKDPSESDRSGRSLLHKAVVRGNIDLVRYLIEQGADVNITDCIGNTPLHLACNPPCFAIAKMLCDAGADPHAVSPLCRKSPLSIATSQVRRYNNLSRGGQNSKLTSNRFKMLIDSARNIVEMFDKWRDPSSEREVADIGLSSILGELDLLGRRSCPSLPQAGDDDFPTSVHHDGSNASCPAQLSPMFGEWRGLHDDLLQDEDPTGASGLSDMVSELRLPPGQHGRPLAGSMDALSQSVSGITLSPTTLRSSTVAAGAHSLAEAAGFHYQQHNQNNSSCHQTRSNPSSGSPVCQRGAQCRYFFSL